MYIYVYLYYISCISLTFPSHFLTELLGPEHCVGRSLQRRRVWCTDDRGAGPASPYAPTKEKRHLKTSGDRFLDVYGEFYGILIYS